MVKKREQGVDAKATKHTDLTKVQEADFNYATLNQIFFEKLGGFRGTRKLVIGGIEVTKQVSMYISNSGKSRSSDVTISWVGSDGIAQTRSNGGSRFAGNRRNDEKRNWGLPE